MRIKLLVAFFTTSMIKCSAQKIEILSIGTKTSIRGLSVVNDNILWASGSNGTVARTTNGGKTFQWFTVKNFEKRDFRDVEAFDSNTAIIMAVAEPAIILKTKDGGQTWKEVFSDTTKGMFLDAMDFVGSNGVVIGDPINNKIFMGYTNDSGDSWKISPIVNDIKIEEGEAFFASSGTNIKFWKDEFPVFVSGGKKPAIYLSSTSHNILPITQGQESTGANSIAISPGKSSKAIVVGGDFAKDTVTSGNCTLINLMALQFQQPQTPPHGYRSCVEYISENKIITCGTSGVDISNDGGMNWQLISKESFHVCQKTKKGISVFLAGSNGKIAKLIW